MGDIFKFLERHVAASFFGAVGVILAALGFAEEADAIATRFEPWQLQAVGAAFFVVFVVKVLASYDERHRLSGNNRAPDSVPVDSLPDKDAQTSDLPILGPTGRIDPNTVPQGVVEKYLSLKLSDHTSLQENRFLKSYVGKWINLDLVLVNFSIGKDVIRAQLYCATPEGTGGSAVFAEFDRKWEDHLEQVKHGDKLSFRAKIDVDSRGTIKFVEAEPA